MENPLANIPSIDQILSQLLTAQSHCDRKYIKILIQEEISRINVRIKKNKTAPMQRESIMKLVTDSVVAKIERLINSSLIKVINATGVVLHTGLGRAPLGAQDIQLLQAYTTYTNLELDLKSGKRGERLDHVEELLILLTGCQSAAVVNNNAAAVLLVLNTLTRGRAKEVIISRGEQIEIGGSFRLPDVMRNSGAKMIEIGTTNKTHLHDYAQAITEKTAAILIAHPSNYQILGFTAKANLSEIVTLAHRHGLPVIFDLGSGALINMQRYGYDQEPVVEDLHRIGVDILTFSGDKLLGGPQAGIITGKKDILTRIRKNSLLRALRCDKLTLSLLNHTLRKYLKSDTLTETNMTLNLLTRSLAVQKKMAGKIKKGLQDKRNIHCELIDDFGRVGSGAYPLAEIPACSLLLSIKSWSPAKIARCLRMQSVPIIGYIQNEAFHLNMLTVLDEDIDTIIKTLNNLS